MAKWSESIRKEYTMSHPMTMAKLSALLIAAASAGSYSLAFAQESHSAPSASEMSPSEWRKQQLVAADKSDRIMQEAEKMPGLLAQYDFMKLNYDTNHDRAFQVIFGQYLSWYQTYVGDYDGARSSFSIAQPVQSDDGPSPLSGNFTPRPAPDVILSMAKDRKAVFFNEAHSAPITRTLTVELLAKLREQGFNYFAAETLYATDHDLQKRRYATTKSGFYVNEPIYGEMVRSALRLGYTVVAYDVEDAGVGDARERAGAERLNSEVFKKDPKARLVLDAGFAHIQKSGKYLGGSSMAEFFQKISGIEPLCIEQTMLIQHGRSGQDHPVYLAVTQATALTQPTVFVGADGKPWTLKPGAYDMSVFFPPGDSNQRRPSWLSLGGLRTRYPVNSDLCHNVTPCLVEARYADEGDDAIPADRTLIRVVAEGGLTGNRVVSQHGEAQGELYLRPGSYRLSAMDERGHTLSGSEITLSGADAGTQ
jgi:hypothetical protein